MRRARARKGARGAGGRGAQDKVEVIRRQCIGVSAHQKLELLTSLVRTAGFDSVTVFGDCFDEVPPPHPSRNPTSRAPPHDVSRRSRCTEPSARDSCSPTVPLRLSTVCRRAGIGSMVRGADCRSASACDSKPVRSKGTHLRGCSPLCARKRSRLRWSVAVGGQSCAGRRSARFTSRRSGLRGPALRSDPGAAGAGRAGTKP